MTRPRLPRDIDQLHYTDLNNLFDTYKPDFYQNVSLGYIRDGYTFGYSGKILALNKNQGRIPAKRGSIHPLPTDTGGVAQVSVASTSANDVGLVAIVGCDLNGDEKMAVHILQGTTPVSVDEGSEWISVHYILYAPTGGQTANEGQISTNAMTDPNRSVLMDIGEGKGCNNLIRCPKWQKLIIPEMRFSIAGANANGGRFFVRTNNYPNNFMWYEQAAITVANDPVTINTGFARAREGGDFFDISCENTNPSNKEDFFWSFTAIQLILADAPNDYERPWYNEVNPTQNPWKEVQG